MQLPVNYKKLSIPERRTCRELYVKQQNNLCYYCKNSLSEKPPRVILDKRIDWKRFPREFLKWPIHLHHNHDTGMTIGAVHGYCNAVLWQYEGE